jgi:hypothetical protein
MHIYGMPYLYWEVHLVIGSVWYQATSEGRAVLPEPRFRHFRGTGDPRPELVGEED